MWMPKNSIRIFTPMKIRTITIPCCKESNFNTAPFTKKKKTLNVSATVGLDIDVPLADFNNRDFIGSFADEPDLAAKSEEIAQGILSRKGIG